MKLDEFQKNFESVHNRKIKYTKDVAPVAHDFKRYKDLKGELSKFEQLLAVPQYTSQHWAAVV